MCRCGGGCSSIQATIEKVVIHISNNHHHYHQLFLVNMSSEEDQVIPPPQEEQDPSVATEDEPTATKETKKLKQSRTKLAGLLFPVNRVRQILKLRNSRVSAKADVALSAAMESIVADICQAGAQVCEKKGAIRIMAQHIARAIQSEQDDELKSMCQNIQFEGIHCVDEGCENFENLLPGRVQKNIAKRERKKKAIFEANKEVILAKASAAKAAALERKSLADKVVKLKAAGKKGKAVADAVV